MADGSAGWTTAVDGIDGLEGVAGMDLADIQELEEHLTEMRHMHGRGDFDAMEDKVPSRDTSLSILFPVVA